MTELKTDSNGAAAYRAKTTIHLGLWTGAWVLTTAVAAFGPKLIWDFDTTLTILAVLINLGIGFVMIMANKRHLQGMDELQQKIFLDAGALTLGVGIVCGISYELLEDIKLISFEPEISHLMMLMSITFVVGMIAGKQKYR